MWGAPAFGWNYWNPGFYLNDWGYRQPARVYIYDNGKRDTIRGKKPVISFHHFDNSAVNYKTSFFV